VFGQNNGAHGGWPASVEDHQAAVPADWVAGRRYLAR
jgi:hypothetical protein